MISLSSPRNTDPTPTSCYWIFCFNRPVSNCLFRRAYTASLGETAVAFDFGPLSAVPNSMFGQKGKGDVVAHPLYILYENGETFLTYVSLVHR